MRAPRAIRWLGSAAVGLAIMAVGHYGIDAMFSPWAYSGLLGSTPLGVWSGVLASPDGGSHRLFLQLEHDSRAGENNIPEITGEAQVCPVAVGEPSRGNIGGRASWTGARLELTLYATVGTFGTQANVPCDWQRDALVCTFDFSRHYSERVEAVARKAGIVTRYPPVRVAFVRVATMPLSCAD